MSETEAIEAIRCEVCRHERTGAHYNIWKISKRGVVGLKEIFPDGEANYMNFALFSTSGVHGCYTTIEEIERGLTKYGQHPAFLDDEDAHWPDDWSGTSLTVTVYHPRIIGVGYGNVEVTLEDIPYLKKLRKSSWDAVLQIGRSSR